MEKAQVGMVGLAVMGQNLIRNVESRGYRCAVYNRSYDVSAAFMKSFGTGKFVAAKTLEELVAALERPRKILIMVKAGAPVDGVIDGLLPLLEKGDVLIEGGNSYFTDTARRQKNCAAKGIEFVGMGVSGGEEGALKGPSLMPGGEREACMKIMPVLQKIAAQAGGACVDYMGPEGAGHFVKMIHNGIEYGDMQLIAEAYDCLRTVLGTKPPELGDIFESWNKGPLSSFLIEITQNIFRRKDDEGSGFLVDMILDKTGQKGTGKWTSQIALDLAVPIPTIFAAVDARTISGLRDQRVAASKLYPAPQTKPYSGDRSKFIAAVHDALYCSKIMSYAQGMSILSAASTAYSWNLDLGAIASIWRGGCIIRAKFLELIKQAYSSANKPANLIFDPTIKEELSSRVHSLREIVSVGYQYGLPLFAFGGSLNYYDAYRTENLPLNLTQAQRDYFGAHTYERRDKSGVFHSKW